MLLDVLWAAFRDAMCGKRYDEAHIIRLGCDSLESELQWMAGYASTPTTKMAVVSQEGRAA